MIELRPVLAVVPAVLALVVSTLAPFGWLPVLRRLGVVDVPTDRSSHTVPTARGVGVAPATAVLVAVPATLLLGGPRLAVAVFLVGLVAALLGLLEDVRGVPAGIRLLAQVGLGLGGGIALQLLTAVPGWAVPVVAVALATYVNAANFMDGIDGISAAHGLVCGLYFVLLGLTGGASALAVGGSVLAAAFLGFAPWNLGRLPVFLGDCGSYLLGGCVGMLVVVAVASGQPLLVAVAPTLPYLADTGVTLVRRVLRGERVWQPHRQHVYQQLARSARDHRKVAGAVALTSVLCSLAAASTDGRLLGWALCVAVLSAYLLSPRWTAAARLTTVR